MKNKKINIFKGDSEQIAQIKINLSLYGTFFYNSIYAGFTLILGLWYNSSWYLSIAIYYILLAVIRFSLLYYSKSNKAGEDMLSELNRFKICGIFLLLLNTALSAITLFRAFGTYNLPSNDAIALIFAVFTISLFALSIKNIIKYRKYNSPILFAAKLISFSSALVSMLSLETAIIGRYAESIPYNTQRIISTASSFLVLTIIGCIGILMIIKSQRAIIKLKKSNKIPDYS